MKKIITLIAALAVVFSSYGVALRPAQALERVTGSPKTMKSLGAKANAPRLVMTGETASGEAAYYVFTNAAGTLFVSADDVALPLLGYSDSANFDPNNIPPQLKWWLDQYSAEIEWASKYALPRIITNGPTEQSEETQTSMEAISPLLTSLWDQEAPFNNYCPNLNGVRTVTGCVATAMAQVMYYFKWPKTEVPALSYTWNGITLESSAVTLKWDNMLPSYNGSYSSAEGDAVAALMQAAGYSVKMDYNTAANGGSSAISSDVRNALINTFGYDVTANFLTRDYYETEEWEQIIYDNLKNVGPVYYKGRGSAGGHAFVCDGYDGAGKYHMNWGWGGMSDGYFVLSALNPGALGTGGGGGGFNSDQGAIIGIQTPKEGSVPPAPFIGCSGTMTGTLTGKTLTVGTTTSNDGFWNLGYEAGTFSFGVKIENADASTTVYCESSVVKNYSLKANYGMNTFTVILPTLENGTYKIYPVYKLGSGDWQLMKLYNGTPKYLTLNKTDEGMSLEGVEPPEQETEGKLSFVAWESSTGFMSEQDYQGALTITNTFTTEQSLSFSTYLCKIENNSYKIYADLGDKSVTIPAKSEIEVEYSGTLARLAAGEYLFTIVQDDYVVWTTPVEVTSLGDFTITNVTINPQILKAGKESIVEVEIENSYQTDKTYTLYCGLYTLNGNQYSGAFSYGKVSQEIASNSTAKYTFQATVPTSVANGTYYLLLVEPTNKIMYSTEIVVNTTQTAVEIITDDNAANYRYFNLQGAEVNPQNLVPGIYIRQSGNKAEKIIIR